MKNDLIDRYIYAVTRRMNPKIREDVKKELYGLVDDMLTERCGGRTPEEKEIRVVLTEIGSPQEVYAKYDEDSQKCFIGQPYYSTYKFVLRIVLLCVALGMTIACGIQQAMEPQVWYGALADWLAKLWQSELSAFGFLTLLFAFFYRKGIRIDEPFNFDNLPPVPQKKQEISKWDPIIGIVISVLFLTVFLAVPQVFSVIYGEGKETVPISNAETIRGNWYILVLFAAAGIIREAVKLMEKQYNRRVAAVTVAADLSAAVLSIWWLSRPGLIDPVFQEKMAVLFAGDASFIATIFGRFQYFFLAVILFALVLDMVTTVVKSVEK